MSKPTVFTRDPTDEDMEIARALAVGFATSLPKGTKSPFILGATSLFVNSVFTRCVKTQYRLDAFDDFAAHIRKQLEKDL